MATRFFSSTGMYRSMISFTFFQFPRSRSILKTGLFCVPDIIEPIAVPEIPPTTKPISAPSAALYANIHASGSAEAAPITARVAPAINEEIRTV